MGEDIVGISSILMDDKVFNQVSDMPIHENLLFICFRRVTKFLKDF